VSKNFYPLISHLIREVSKLSAFGGIGMFSLDYFGQEDGKVGKKELEGYIETLKAMEMYKPGSPLSCGLTANAFCYIFMGQRKPDNDCSDLKTLKEVIADRRQRLIRIDLKGHAYVIEQVDTTARWGEPIGNVYQSNIAVIGGGDKVGIDLQEYLDENPNPVKLNEYLDELGRLASGGSDPSAPVAVDKKIDLYKKLYTTPKYFDKPDAQAITPELFNAHAGSLALHRLGYGDIDERNVLKAVNSILVAYGNLSGANQARDIYFTRCWG